MADEIQIGTFSFCTDETWSFEKAFHPGLSHFAIGEKKALIEEIDKKLHPILAANEPKEWDSLKEQLDIVMSLAVWNELRINEGQHQSLAGMPELEKLYAAHPLPEIGTLISDYRKIAADVGLLKTMQLEHLKKIADSNDISSINDFGTEAKEEKPHIVRALVHKAIKTLQKEVVDIANAIKTAPPTTAKNWVSFVLGDPASPETSPPPF